MVDKNGAFFVSVIEQEQYIPSVWDPYTYQACSTKSKLEQFVTAKKVSSKVIKARYSPFSPIEYRDIPEGNYLSFKLERKVLEEEPGKGAWISESSLLFGTMRAYLGNVIITPKCTWIGYESSICFQAKSEFVNISPHDELIYFWLVYFRSKQFLKRLPLGGGGTRPRLQPELLYQVPVDVPAFEIRKAIHDKVEAIAEVEWRNYFSLQEVINSLF